MKIFKVIMIICVLLSFTVANTGCYYKELKREEGILYRKGNQENVPLENFKDIKEGMTLDEVLTTVGREPYNISYSSENVLETVEWLLDGELKTYLVAFEKGQVVFCGENDYNKSQKEEQ